MGLGMGDRASMVIRAFADQNASSGAPGAAKHKTAQAVQYQGIAMSRRAFTWCLLMAALTSCKTNQGNGEAQPEDTKHGYNPDSEKNNVRKAGGPGGTNR